MRISLMFCLPICLATYGQVSNRTWHMWLAMIFFNNLVLLQFNVWFGIESYFRYNIDVNTASLSVCFFYLRFSRSLS